MVTLRILTPKSKIGIGAYANETVQKLLDLKMHRALRKIYYTYEAISFQEEILDQIGALIRIEKPGCDRTLIFKVNEMMDLRRFHKLNSEGNNEQAFHEWQHREAEKRHAEKRARKADYAANKLTKGQLQAVNHGHTYLKDRDDNK